MKAFLHTICCCIVLLLAADVITAQIPWVDAVKKQIREKPPDTSLVNALISVADALRFIQPDTSLAYATRALALAEKLQYQDGMMWATINASGACYVLGDFNLELVYTFKMAALARKIKTATSIGYSKGLLSDCYYNLGEYDSAMRVWREVVKLGEDSLPGELFSLYGNSSHIFSGMQQYDSAMLYAKKSHAQLLIHPVFNKDDDAGKWAKSNLFECLGEAFAGEGRYDSAMYYFRQTLLFSRTVQMQLNEMDAYIGLAGLFAQKKGQADSVISYAKKAAALHCARLYPVSLLKAANLLWTGYEQQHNADSALRFLHLSTSLKDSLFNRRKTMGFQRMLQAEQEKQQLADTAAAQIRGRYRLYFVWVGLAVLLAGATVLVINRRRRQIQDMRNSIADDLHDDIGSALSSIRIMSVLAKDKPAGSSELLDAISDNTAMIQENMSDIVWAVNPKNDRFENVTQRMNGFAAGILEAKNMALDFRCDARLSHTRLSMNQRKNFYLFFKEAINNAAKYSKGGKVLVDICQKGHYMEMMIADDGTGFDPEQTSNGNGMASLKKRGDELNGTLTIVSKIQEGTRVELRFRIP